MVIWIIGKSGAGKTTIGKKLYYVLKEQISNLIYLDGDIMREELSWDLGHSIQDRYVSEKRRSNLCKLLSDQGVSIICAALSNAPDLREWNKKNINNYFEVYIKVRDEVLYRRDTKKLYEKFNNNEIKNVVGQDIPFHEPKNPSLVINNDLDESIDKIISKILSYLKKKKIVF
tara:strand:+ start:69 stop:587 length:519 start_codon:yes stop_codon:yes gene_type:complete